MVSVRSPAELPVAVLFNVDPQWSSEDQQTVIAETRVLCDALRQLSHPVTEWPIRSFKELKQLLVQLKPQDQILFNWCEDIPRIKRGEQMAARTMEKAGFVVRRPDAEDQRISRVYLADAGRTIRAGVEQVWRTLDAETFAGFDPPEQMLIRRLLERMRNNLLAVR